MFQIRAIFLDNKEWWKTLTGILKVPQLKPPAILSQMSWTISSILLYLHTVHKVGDWHWWKAVYWHSQHFACRWTWYDTNSGNSLEVPELTSLCLCKADMGFYECKCERFGGLPFAQKMASSGNIPFSTFSGLLEGFQLEDSHLLNHEKTLALLWMSFIQVSWPGLTLFRLRSNEPTTQGAVVALSRLCK